MEKKNIIIIGILIVIICILIGAIFVTLTNSVNYERIEIVPNGTSIEIPTNQAQYIGDTEGIKFWNWSNGALITYNSQEGSNTNELSGALGFYAIKELIKTGNSENIDGFTIYKLDGNKLSHNIKTNTNGEFYCIHLVNDTTHDNIIICCKDKNIAIHIAKSIQYKTVTFASTNDKTVNSTTSSPSKTFPVYADDGTLIGYFAPGSIVHPSPNDDSYIVNSDGSLSLYSRGNDYYDNSADDSLDEDTDTISNSDSSNGGGESSSSSLETVTDSASDFD